MPTSRERAVNRVISYGRPTGQGSPDLENEDKNAPPQVLYSIVPNGAGDDRSHHVPLPHLPGRPPAGPSAQPGLLLALLQERLHLRPAGGDHGPRPATAMSCLGRRGGGDETSRDSSFVARKFVC